MKIHRDPQKQGNTSLDTQNSQFMSLRHLANLASWQVLQDKN